MPKPTPRNAPVGEPCIPHDVPPALVQHLASLVPNDPIVYLEVFAGAAPVFFELWNSNKLDDTVCVLNDLDPDLVAMYESVRDEPEELHGRVRGLSHDYRYAFNYEFQKWYEHRRDDWNEGAREPHHTFWLRHAVNGGEWKTDFAKNLVSEWNGQKEVFFPDLDHLHGTALALADVDLLDWSLLRLDVDENIIGPGAVILVRPPRGRVPRFYRDAFFFCVDWVERGATVVVSCPSDAHHEVEGLFDDFFCDSDFFKRDCQSLPFGGVSLYDDRENERSKWPWKRFIDEPKREWKELVTVGKPPSSRSVEETRDE